MLVLNGGRVSDGRATVPVFSLDGGLSERVFYVDAHRPKQGISLLSHRDMHRLPISALKRMRSALTRRPVVLPFAIRIMSSRYPRGTSNHVKRIFTHSIGEMVAR